MANDGEALNAEETGRRCYMMELDPRYVDVAVRRWQTFTGHTAIHAHTGESFEAASKARTTEMFLLPPPQSTSEGD